MTEDEMLFDEDGGEDGEPISQDIEHGFKPFFKMACTGDRQNNVDDTANDDDEDSRYGLGVGMNILQYGC